MQPQYQRANAEPVDAVGEDYQSHSHEVVYHLLLEVLQKTVGHHQNKPLCVRITTCLEQAFSEDP